MSKLSRLIRHPLVKKAIFGGGGHVLAAITALGYNALVGRELGAGEAGYFFLAFNIVFVLSALSRMGADNTVIRFTAADSEQGNQARAVMAKAGSATLCLSILSALLLFFGADFISSYLFQKPELSHTLRSIAPAVCFISLFTLFSMGLQGLQKPFYAVLILNVLSNFIALIWVYVALVGSASEMAIIYVVSSFFTVLVGCLLWFRYSWSTPIQLPWSEFLESALPLWFAMLLTVIIQWSGQLIAAAWVSSDEIAQLSVAQRTAMLTSFVLLAVNLVVAPRFASLYKQGELERLATLAINSVRAMVILSLPILLVLIVYGDFVMSLFGEGFEQGADLLKVLALGQFVNVFTGSVGYLLTMSGHEKEMRLTLIITAPIAILVGFTLVPIWGAMGSAVATAFSIATQNLLAVWWVKKRLGFNTLAVWKH